MNNKQYIPPEGKTGGLKEVIRKVPVLSSLLFCMIIGGIGLTIWGEASQIVNNSQPGDIVSMLPMIFYGMIFGGTFLYSGVLTVINIILLVQRKREGFLKRVGKRFEVVTIVLGALYSYVYLVGFSQICFMADWVETLYNRQLHTPILQESFPTIIVLSLIGILGYIVLSVCSIEKTSPIVFVASMACMYCGMAMCTLWIIQICANGNELLALLPFNCIIIALKVIKEKIIEWRSVRFHPAGTYKFPLLTWIDIKLSAGSAWSLWAFLFLLPLLGIMLAVLVLCGQAPDAVIKAWTQTSDWNLSQKIAPQNIEYDEHYLCTVAAGGHKKVVKPQRVGIRHGHQVVVNRQLCIANAFEEIIMEKTPNFHRHLRIFYDNYGYPVARLVKSKYTADFIYFVMKPLEWFFLFIIYAVDAKPENRISMQYILPVGQRPDWQ